MEKGLISVIMPAYNRGDMIVDSVRSVSDQTYANLELIVVDDGSTDNTSEVVRNYPDNRIRLIEIPNQGAYVARNTGIEQSRGEYIAFLDSDDLWLPAKLEMQLACAQENQVEFVFTNGFNFEEGEAEYHMNSMTRALRIFGSNRKGQYYHELLGGNFIATSSVMMSRRLINEVGFFVNEKRRRLDYEMWLRVAETHEMGFIPEGLFLRKLHSGSLSRNEVARLRDLQYVYDLESERCVRNGWKRELKIIKRAQTSAIARTGVRFSTADQHRTARKYFFRALVKRNADLIIRVVCLAGTIMPGFMFRSMYKSYSEMMQNPELKPGLKSYFRLVLSTFRKTMRQRLLRLFGR